jgi:hypothetical protein
LCQAESLAIVPGTIPIASIVADSTQTTGLKWQAPASGGMTLLSTTTLSSTTTTINISDTSYVDLYVICTGNTSASVRNDIALRYNGVTTGYYWAVTSDSSTSVGRAQNVTAIDTGVGSSRNFNNTNGLLEFTIPNYAATGFHNIQFSTSYFTEDNLYRVAQGIGFNQDTGAIASISFVTGNAFTAGTVKVYGVK